MTRIIVVSGGTGASGRQLVRTALAQFAGGDAQVEVAPLVRKPAELEAVVERAAAAGALIAHTLVDAALRRELVALARRHQVVEIDLMGGLLDQLAQQLGQSPLGQPGLYRKQNEEDLRRIEAINFTVDHDDGKRAYELGQAEIVLAGVSRVGKTPLSMYLATLGWKVANIPLIKDIRPPKELYEIDSRRVIGLTIQPGQLLLHRKLRAQHMGAGRMASYAEAETSTEELDYARRLFRMGQFRVVETTDKPIEETAQEILNLVRPWELVVSR
ncbi:MAG: kinase/pyrophosphorylase [Anaerolineae bacterium]|nr:kinase/pyrophosphorylase [Anaerolineae bacterium]NUQ05574.1 kinase/pyrophosphorylase [Anaerolineae bacterium]